MGRRLVNVGNASSAATLCVLDQRHATSDRGSPERRATGCRQMARCGSCQPHTVLHIITHAVDAKSLALPACPRFCRNPAHGCAWGGGGTGKAPRDAAPDASSSNCHNRAATINCTTAWHAIEFTRCRTMPPGLRPPKTTTRAWGTIRGPTPVVGGELGHCQLASVELPCRDLATYSTQH